MGASNWSDDLYSAAVTTRSTTKGVSAFTHDNDIKKGVVAAKTHDRLNPKGVTRESRDSDVHPTSNAIAVMFDVTGSMGGVPRVLQTKLSKLMSVLGAKAAIEHPQILFGAVGDCISDKAPLQVGQFESGVEMDEDIDKIYLEGNGGGQVYESYELAMYFAARHTSLDCFEKRGKKGYLFLIGDEKARNVDRSYVKEIFGDTLESDIALQDIVNEVQQKYEVYFIIPTNTSHGSESQIQDFWRKLFGQNVLRLDNEELVCELIATTIALSEDHVDDVKDLASDLKLDKAGLSSLTNALSEVQSSRSTGLRKAKVEGDLVASGPSSVETL